MSASAHPYQQQAILLVDNGSSRPESTLNLRRLATRLAERLGQPVQPVSLLHADRIPAQRLGGQPAEILEEALRRLWHERVRDIVILPLFFGRSAALTQFVPETADRLAAHLGPLTLTIAPELCPLPQGEPLLVKILEDQISAAARMAQVTPRRVVLVDHGSPLPQVTAVRQWLAKQLEVRFAPEVELIEAAMERRPGPDYEFNGPLLADRLETLAEDDAKTPVILAMLFISPGRHAGPHGDIAQICAQVKARHPALPILVSPLVGEHPALIEILANRLAAL